MGSGEEAARRIAYYRDCYRADGAALSLFHAFAKTEGHHGLIDVPILFGRPGTQHFLDAATAASLREFLERQGREYALCVWLFPLAATGRAPSKRTAPVLAPAVLYEARFAPTPGGGGAIEIDLTRPHANTSFLNYIAAQIDHFDHDAAAAVLTPGRWTDIEVDQLHEYVSALDGGPVSALRVHEENFLDVSVATEEPTRRGRVLPLAGWSVVKRPRRSLGVLHELDELAAGAQRPSAPLRALLLGGERDDTYASNRADDHPVMVAASLSDAQRGVVRSTERRVVTRVIGPPGTGKSYTCAAIASHAFAEGRSVLIVSKHAAALDAVGEKFTHDFETPDLIIEAHRGTLRTQLRNRLKRALNRVGVRPVDVDAQRATRADIVEKTRQMRLHTREFRRAAERAAVLGRRFHRARTRWYGRAYAQWLLLRTASAKTLNEITGELRATERLMHASVRANKSQLYEARLGTLVNREFASLKAFYEGLRAREGLLRERYFADVDTDALLRALPVWTCTTASLHTVLPLEREAFDLVILDEASQLDIASALPAVQRAKRIAVVGDPYQLRHVSFVSRLAQRRLRRRYGLADEPALDFGGTSLLDLAEERTVDGSSVFMLDEHYRSQPEIIAFSNEEYYGGSLKIMTRGLRPPTRPSATVERVRNATTDARGRNGKEVEAILGALREILARWRARHPDRVPSVGVTAPFTSQVGKLQATIRERLPAAQLARHRLLVGTPHEFQGQERDVMLISMTLAGDSSSQAWRYLERDGVLNVMVTRARSLQRVFVSFDVEGANPELLPVRYAQSVEDYGYVAKRQLNSRGTDALRDAVANFLGAELPDAQVESDIAVAGQRLDLLVTTNDDRRVAIDLTHIPGERGAVLSVHAVRSLGRIDIEVYYLSGIEWLLRPEQTRVRLLERLRA